MVIPLPPRFAVAGAAVSAVLTASVLLTPATAAPPDATPPGGSRVAATRGGRSVVARPPQLITLDAGTPLELAALSSTDRRALAQKLADTFAEHAESSRASWAVARLTTTPLRYAALDRHDRRALDDAYGASAAARYDDAMARFVEQLLSAIDRRVPSASIGLYGLPVEAPRLGAAEARAANEAYRDALRAVDVLVSDRTFIALGSRGAANVRPEDALPEAMRVRDDRPVLYRVNETWQLVTPPAVRDAAPVLSRAKDETLAPPTLLESAVTLEREPIAETPPLVERRDPPPAPHRPVLGAPRSEPPAARRRHRPEPDVPDVGEGRLRTPIGVMRDDPDFVDCDRNGVDDREDIRRGDLEDCNHDGIPDICAPPPDSDGDGVPDCADGCPNDPLKTNPGACGCGEPDTDSDGDGWPDCNDDCPNDPNKVTPGACGCGVPDTDSDNDGTPDCADGCPNDPAKTAPGECGCGVPESATCGAPTVLVPGGGFGSSLPNPSPAGVPNSDGYDAQAIARWNVIPHQEIDGAFTLGVVAFHKRGIARVAFAVEGGPWFNVTEMTYNERTETWEYVATIDPAHFESDGEVEVRAIVHPVVGEARVLAGPLDGSVRFRNGEHSMFLVVNATGDLAHPVYYCSAFGNDATGDGSPQNPFRQPSRALLAASQTHGTADGTTVYLRPGTYTWGPKPWPLIETAARWPVITPAPGVSRDQVIINEGLVGGFSTNLICARNVTINGHMTVRGGGSVWLDQVKAVGPGTDGEYNSLLFQGNTDFLAEYVTASDISQYRNGIREATLTRDCHVHHIWGVPFGMTGLVINSTAEHIDEMGTGSHGDILRWLLTSDDMENYITYGLNVLHADVQGIFAEVHNGHTRLDDVAIVNVHISKDSVSANGSWWEPTTNHLLLWHVSMPDQVMRWPQEQYGTSITNLSIVGSVFAAFTHTPLPNTPSDAFVRHIHFTEPDTYGAFVIGDDRSEGNPRYVNPDAGDYMLLPASPLRHRIPDGGKVVHVDRRGMIRMPTTALGSLADPDNAGGGGPVDH